MEWVLTITVLALAWILVYLYVVASRVSKLRTRMTEIERRYGRLSSLLSTTADTCESINHSLRAMAADDAKGDDYIYASARNL